MAVLCAASEPPLQAFLRAVLYTDACKGTSA
eukprot:CAMPEP_0197675394 /NCGR_PEP_ID=MMETSP1338-20131121/84878_1 /TAXON_ID=43686 ORGANISM="Pelagodinium beii, Strain RCC1491" /NCGR_SAMPLE_ID=MMETSP1338 /ASSEMBLY_ACC=CAM_ASM_000754 /LENGTH=30 /DNA_ID= /DNA_START= /DNA_END= /DNA_ORIENTATION=